MLMGALLSGTFLSGACALPAAAEDMSDREHMASHGPMTILRTPDSQFADLPGYAFEPR